MSQLQHLHDLGDGQTFVRAKDHGAIMCEDLFFNLGEKLGGGMRCIARQARGDD